MMAPSARTEDELRANCSIRGRGGESVAAAEAGQSGVVGCGAPSE